MAAAGIRPGNEGANALRQEWDADIKTKPNEESVVTKRFGKPMGVDKIGEQLHIRILPTVAANRLETTAQGQGAGITYHTGNILEVTCDPFFSYGIVELPDHFLSKLNSPDQAAIKAGYRKQLMASLNEDIDREGGELAAGASVTKGAPSDFDKSLLLDALGTLRQNAKEFVKDGTPMYLCYHPSQIRHVNAIGEITNAYATGKSRGNIDGVVIDAWGAELAESGNVWQDAGVTYNLLHAKEAFVKAFNVEPTMKDPQEFEFVTRMPAYSEAGVVEVFDEAVVAILSPV